MKVEQIQEEDLYDQTKADFISHEYVAFSPVPESIMHSVSPNR